MNSGEDAPDGPAGAVASPAAADVAPADVRDTTEGEETMGALANDAGGTPDAAPDGNLEVDAVAAAAVGARSLLPDPELDGLPLEQRLMHQPPLKV